MTSLTITDYTLIAWDDGAILCWDDGTAMAWDEFDIDTLQGFPIGKLIRDRTPLEVEPHPIPPDRPANSADGGVNRQRPRRRWGHRS